MTHEEKKNLAKKIMNLLIDANVTLYDSRYILARIETLAGDLVLKEKESEDS